MNGLFLSSHIFIFPTFSIIESTNSTKDKSHCSTASIIVGISTVFFSLSQSCINIFLFNNLISYIKIIYVVNY
ncbi:hypothetical protein HOF65_00955 [bacterium]|nr:hypothetical protein [bacterium]MBT3852611.1 hypothetical protein [bacterium]MBT4633436.1 hypothetical protein [bacterium]MBT6779132.1 hypothetical protein [bacterium]